MLNGRRTVRVAIQLNDGFRQYVWIDKQTHLPVAGRSEPKSGGGSSWTEHWEINVPIDPALFTYEPPAGFEVIERGRR